MMFHFIILGVRKILLKCININKIRQGRFMVKAYHPNTDFCNVVLLVKIVFHP